MTNTLRKTIAASKGLKFFDPVAPCKRGHDAQRYVSTGDCVLCIKEGGAANYQKNRARRLEGRKKRREENRMDENNKRRERNWKRYQDDALYRLQNSISSLIRRSFNSAGKAKIARTHEILGCTILEFMVHIEKQFSRGMSWENRDKWHIDHITPISTAKTAKEIYALNHCSNLRPMWAKDNLNKSARLTHLI